MNDDEAWMAWFIKEYDKTEDPDLRAELLMCHGIHPQILASERRRLARRAQSQPTEQQTTTPFVPHVPRTFRTRATRRPTTPRRVGGPRTYRIKVTRTKKIHTAKRTATVVTVTTTFTTVTTVTTVTTINS
ncbi:hypothetical protein [Streptomyces sp. NPDC002685]|uniref:hypothetical protein n=1 Tax=Streptomyces sp. NPDC002685 TaxID=3154540 RepID=UPI0033237D78